VPTSGASAWIAFSVFLLLITDVMGGSFHIFPPRLSVVGEAVAAMPYCTDGAFQQESD